MEPFNHSAGLTQAQSDKLDKISVGVKSNLNATVAPTVTDDSSKGYSAESQWTYSGVLYVCTDATVNASVWMNTNDIYYFDDWNSLVAAISVIGNTYVNKYCSVTNANNGVPSGVTYTSPATLSSTIVDGGSATYKINAMGTNWSVTCQKRQIINPAMTAVANAAVPKPTAAGYYPFIIMPTDGLPVGASLGDICYYDGATWSKFQSYASANAILVVGTITASQVLWRKQAGSWVNVTDNSDISVGDVKLTARAAAPAGWLVCDGSAISRVTYANLFSAIGTAFGTGNGSTTFNIPKLAGNVPVGFDSSQTEFNTLGKTGGEKTHILSVTELPSHTHTYSFPTGTRSVFGTGGDSALNGGSSVYNTGLGTGGNGAHNNLQPYTVLNYIIKY